MRAKLTSILAVAVGGFIYYTAAAGAFESLIQRAVFVNLVVALGVLLYPLGAGRGWRPLGAAADLVIVVLTTWACVYVVGNYDFIMNNLPTATNLEIFLTAALVVVILEISRRAVGWLFPILVVLGLAYALLGHLIPGPLGHRGFDVAFVVENLFLGDLGIWGLLVGLSATTIASFILFGSILLFSGGGQTFIDLASRLSGATPGGAAKIAIIASSLFGTVSGSAVANVATTGNFTIPLMKRLGYPSALAGGVESVASTGGQIMPPIMGAGAFIMAEIIGRNYWDIALSAAMPAFLFFLGLYATLHVVATRLRLGMVAAEDLPDWRRALSWRRLGPAVMGFLGLAWGIAGGHSVPKTVFYGMMGIVLAFYAGRVRAVGDLKPATRELIKGLEDGGKGVVIVGILLAGAQILVSMINLTGLGITLSGLILSTAGNNLWAVAVITGAVCMIAGMGLPTTAAYVLVAATLAPAMIKTGVTPIVAHMFVFYYATISVITPPVCVAVYVAAGIAQTHWLKVAKEALRFGFVTYVIPLLFLVYPGLLMQGGWVEVLDAALSGGVFALACGCLFGGRRAVGPPILNVVLWGAIAAASLVTVGAVTGAAFLALVALNYLSRRRTLAATGG